MGLVNAAILLCLLPRVRGSWTVPGSWTLSKLTDSNINYLQTKNRCEKCDTLMHKIRRTRETFCDKCYNAVESEEMVDELIEVYNETPARAADEPSSEVPTDSDEQPLGGNYTKGKKIFDRVFGTVATV